MWKEKEKGRSDVLKPSRVSPRQMNATGETGARWKIHRPLKVGMEKRVTWEKWDRTARKKSKSEMRTMGTGKRDFTVLDLPKNERDEDRERIWKVYPFFIRPNVSFLILLLPDYRSFPTAWCFARNRVA